MVFKVEWYIYGVYCIIFFYFKVYLEMFIIKSWVLLMVRWFVWLKIVGVRVLEEVVRKEGDWIEKVIWWKLRGWRVWGVVGIVYNRV